MTDASLRGTFRPDADLALTGPLPEDPATIETFNVWIFDGRSGVGFNLHPHAHLGSFNARVTVFLPDGRVLRGESPSGPFDLPAEPGNEHLRLRCIEPFERWDYDLVDLPVLVTTGEELHAGRIPIDRAPSTTVSLHAEATMAAPPWDWGTLFTEEREASRGQVGLWIANRLTSGRVEGVSYRYDQALTATGTVTVDGETFEFDGAGLRGHVRGVRIMDGFETHVWTGAVFPNGTTFGANTMLRSDGGFHANEGYVFKDGVFYPNRVRWCTPVDARADDTDHFVLELVCDELGLTRISGRDRAKLWWILGSPMGYGRDLEAPVLFSQAVAEFELDGEVGYGMNERSWFGPSGRQMGGGS